MGAQDPRADALRRRSGRAAGGRPPLHDHESRLALAEARRLRRRPRARHAPRGTPHFRRGRALEVVALFSRARFHPRRDQRRPARGRVVVAARDRDPSGASSSLVAGEAGPVILGLGMLNQTHVRTGIERFAPEVGLRLLQRSEWGTWRVYTRGGLPPAAAGAVPFEEVLCPPLDGRRGARLWSEQITWTRELARRPPERLITLAFSPPLASRVPCL